MIFDSKNALFTGAQILGLAALTLGQPMLAADTGDAQDGGNAVNTEGKLSRWVDLDAFNFAARYRSIFDCDGVHNYDQGQQRSLIQGKFKFDKDGKYSIGFRLSSGHYFDWAYADFMGGGTNEAVQAAIPRLASPDDRAAAIAAGPNAVNYPSGGWSILPRQLYFNAKPIDALEFQYGSLGFNRGDGSEITTYDEDGYVAGGRLMIRKPDALYFDEISVTYGSVGYLLTPNFFERVQGLEHFNYHQFLVRKRLTHWLDVSTDYTWDIANTMREAAYVKTKPAKVVDSVRVEAYQRLNSINLGDDSYPSGSGYAVTASKSFAKKVSIDAGYADIDYNYDVYSNNGNNAIWGFSLNGDQYGMGKRPFVRTNIKITPYLSLFGFYTHLIDFNYGNDGYVWNQTALNAGIQIDFKSLLQLDRH